MNLTLFSSGSINQLTLRNRFVRSATHEGMATETGVYTPELIALLEKLAQNQVGLIISGHTFVAESGRASQWQSGAVDPQCGAAWRQATQRIHDAGGKIFLQLAHAGANGVNHPKGPSVCLDKNGEIRAAMMTCDEIDQVVAAFERAADEAKKCGFDGVQLHAAHGYLISEFLSPLYNQRDDEYGGSLENRARLLFRVLEAVRDRVGRDFPVIVKLNSEDYCPGGMTQSEALWVAQELERRSIDAIELSGGLPDSGPKLSPVRLVPLRSPDDPLYFEEAARKLKQTLTISVILVGGLRHFAKAEQLIATGACDFVSMCRPLICEPDLIRRWQYGDTAQSQCLSCNACFRPIMTGRSCYCVVLAKKTAK